MRRRPLLVLLGLVVLLTPVVPAAGHVDAHDPTYPNSPYFAMGISVGAADIYPWYLADQYLDITDVPDGRYLLRVQIDAGGKLVEKTHANNTAITCVDLHGEAATPCHGQISRN